MIAIGTVLIAVTVSLLITRIATIVLTATGMSHEAARFQARSAFTGAGFTTAESERVVSHPIRRRVAMTLMLLGNAGIITIAASVILSLTRAEGTADTALRISLLIGGLLSLLLLTRSDAVNRRLNRWITWGLARWTDISVRDLASLLQISGEFGVSELRVATGDWVAGRTLADLRLRDEGAVVLGIQRRGQYIGLPHGDARVLPGDTLIIYGRASILAELDQRRAGPPGDRRHREAADGTRQRSH